MVGDNLETNRGFIILYRKMIDWEWYTEPNVVRVFLHCLLLANHTEKKWKGKTIERGSFITSYEKIGLGLRLSVQQVRTAINKLKSTGELTIKTTNKYSTISIINYNLYQNSEVNQQATQQTNNKQITNNQQTNNKQITTTNNDNNDNHYNNDNNDNNILVIDKIDYQSVVDYYHLTCVEFPKIKTLTQTRKQNIKKRIEQHGKESLKVVFDKAQASDFLSGRKKTKNEKHSNWKANLDWLLKSENFVKVLEGNYDNSKSEKTLKDIDLGENDFWNM